MCAMCMLVNMHVDLCICICVCVCGVLGVGVCGVCVCGVCVCVCGVSLCSVWCVYSMRMCSQYDVFEGEWGEGSRCGCFLEMK